MKIEYFNNAYGIKELKPQECFNDENGENLIIYAPNGTFKSSFSKAFYNWNQGQVKDFINDIDFKCKIKIGESETVFPEKIDNVLVYSRELEDDNHYEHIKNLVMSNLDRTKIDQYNSKIKAYQEKRRKLLETINVKEKDYLSIIDTESKKSVIDGLLDFYKGINRSNTVKDLDKLISFDKINQKAYQVLDKDEVKEQFKSFQKLVKSRVQSDFYDEDFTEQSGTELIKSLENTHYLNEKKKRGLTVNEETYFSMDEINNLFKEKLDKTMQNPEVSEKQKSLMQNLGKAKLAEEFKQKLIDFPEIAINLPIGRDNIIYANIKGNSDFDIEEFGIEQSVEDLKEIKRKLNEIYDNASKNKSRFDQIIEEYNNIFQPVFDIKINNKKKLYSEIESPQVSFSHSRSQIKENEYNKDEINKYLSSGEKSALLILDFLFKFEEAKARLNDNEKLLVILDDIVETFDYRNRSGFVQYAYKLVHDECVDLIVLTHNYEFYNRLFLSMNKNVIPLVASVNEEGIVRVSKNRKIHLNLEKTLQDIHNVKDLLFKIPFLRELATMVKDDDLKSVLTDCLHYKKDTKSLKIENIVRPLSNYCDVHDNENVKAAYNENYFYTLIEEARNTNTDNYFDIKPKIILSIASRVLMEMVATNADLTKLEGVTENQTRYIFNEYGDNLEPKAYELLTKVLLLTPDFIHLNSFMFEPLIDIDPKDLKELFEDIDKLYKDTFSEAV